MDVQISDGSFHGKISECFERGGGESAVTWEHMSQIMETVIDGSYSGSQTYFEIAALQIRIKQLEDAEYCGVWAAGKTYQRYSTVTHDGSLWKALTTTASYPGGGAEPGAWKLIVKRGRDGKDGKDAKGAA